MRVLSIFLFALIAAFLFLAPIRAESIDDTVVPVQVSPSTNVNVPVVLPTTSANSVTSFTTSEQSQQIIIQYEIKIEIHRRVIVRTENECHARGIEIDRLRIEIKSSFNAIRQRTLDTLIAEQHKAEAMILSLRRKVLEYRIAIAVHFQKWGSQIKSTYFNTMNALYADVAQFNIDCDIFLHTIGHGVVVIGEVVLATLLFAGVEAWKAGAHVVHSAEDAWNALFADAKAIWLSFGLHISIFLQNTRNHVNQVKNQISQFGDNVKGGFQIGFRRFRDGKPGECVCPPQPSCPVVGSGSTTPAVHGDSVDEDEAVHGEQHHEQRHHRRSHGVRVAVDVE